MKQFILCLLLAGSIGLAPGQEQPGAPRTGLSVGYLAFRGTGPGGFASVEHTLPAGQWAEIVEIVGLYGYSQANFQTALGVQASIGQRFRTRWGLCAESHLTLGLQQTFYRVTTYTYAGTETQVSQSWVPKTGIAPGVAVGLGYELLRSSATPVRVFARPAITWLYPDRNTGLQSAWALAFGAVWYWK